MAITGNIVVVNIETRNNIVRCRQMVVRIAVTILWLWAGICYGDGLYGDREPSSISIDIKPGDPENIIRTSSGRVISAAIFGSSDLDIISINPRTIRLNGVDVMLVGKSDKSLCRSEDINDDNFADLVCDVRTTGFRVGEGEYKVILRAATYNGESLKGEDRIRIVAN